MADGIYDPLTDELRSVPCPAGDQIADVRGTQYANCPGVRCRVTHDVLDIAASAKVLVKWCCNEAGGDGGFSECPVWRYEKERLEEGRHSMGDEREKEKVDERQWRHDLTGSEYGDTSELDVIEQRVQEGIQEMHEAGASGLIGKTGTSDSIGS
jgi:hypothetical protein